MTYIVLSSQKMDIYMHTYLPLSWHYTGKHVSVSLGEEKKKIQESHFPHTEKA